MTFKDLNLIAPILDALETEGYKEPTPIQAQAIPIALAQRDLLGCAQTGTGKTAAFAIPILQNLHQQHAERNHRHIKTLILTPTRELAIQIGESFAAYGRNLKLRHTVIFGGVSQHAQTQALAKGIDILIATPGRLLDLMQQGYINLKDISIFVLDEADRMLDMGFIHDVKRVIAVLPHKRQTLFFSATMPPEIQKLADTILVNPQKVEVTPVSSTAETVQQSVFYVDKGNKKALLLNVLKANPEMTRVLIFTRTKHGADKLAKDLVKSDIGAEAIHGNKSQNARQRALANFKEGRIRALVATDIAARGIDIDSLAYMINYEIPEVPETYVHRIGRTGRAGASGTAISFCDNEEYADFRNIEKLIGMKISVIESHPYPMTRPPVAPQTPQAQKKTQQQANGTRPPQQKKNFHKNRRPNTGDKPQEQHNRPKPQNNTKPRNHNEDMSW